MARKNVIRQEEDWAITVMGLVSQLHDYRICWHLNKVLGLEMKRLADVELINKKKSKSAFFCLFKYELELERWNVYLVANKYMGEYLIPELKQADFLLVIHGEVDRERHQQMHDAMRKIEGIQAIIPFDSVLLKKKQNLIFE